MVSTNGRNGFMDCTRAICALYIVGFWHLFDYIEKNIQMSVTAQITYGVLAVFTFVSGYFLGMKKVDSIKTTFLFYAKRLISFYPLFVISCILLWKMGGYIGNFKQCILTIMGLSCIMHPVADYYTAWYLCMLMIFYFVTPLFINPYIRGGVKLTFMFTIWFMLVLAAIFLDIDKRLCFYWPFYCGGVLCSKRIDTCKINYIVMLLSILLFIFISMNIGSGIEKLSFVCAVCFLIFILNLGKFLEKTILLEILTKISYASMCAYLFHRPFYFCIRKLTGSFSIGTAYLAILPTLFTLCYGIQYIYDKYVKNKVVGLMFKKK